MPRQPSFFDKLVVTLCASLGWCGMVFAVTGLEVKTQRSGEVVIVKAQATIEAPIVVVWATLTDYERLSQFVPGIKQSKVLSRRGDVVTVAQTGQARFLMFTVPIDVTVQSIERPPGSIEVQRISGTLKQLQGRYDIDAVPDKSGWVQLRWQGVIEPENPLPPLIGEPLMRRMITEQFTGLVQEIERRQALAQSSSNLATSTTTATPNMPATPANASQVDGVSAGLSVTPSSTPTPIPTPTLNLTVTTPSPARP